MPLCGKIAAIVSISDVADRAPQAMDDGEVLLLGRHRVRWFATPHLPHAWECGFLSEESTQTLLCGDSLPRAAQSIPRLRKPTSSIRAKPSAARWTIIRTPRTLPRSSGW